MSGTNIPMMGVAPDIAGQAGKFNQNLLTAAQLPQVQAQTGQTIAQTGLIGQQTQAANIQNQIAGARLPFLMNAYGQGGAPAGGAAPGGAPGAIGASGDQNWTGPDGIIPAPGTPFAAVGAMPKSTYTEAILSPNEKWSDVAANLRTQKNAYVNQAVAATIDPSTGQADPTKWNQMVQDEVQSGWMDAVNARKLYGHPELAQTLLNSTLPAGEQPGTKQATAAATAAGTATQQFVEETVTLPDGTTQKRMVPKLLVTGGQGSSGSGNGATSGALPADLTSNISTAASTYGVPASWLTRTAQIESSGRSGAVSPTGAKGAFQFTGPTAQSVGVNDPTDNHQAAMGAARLYLENKAALTASLGRPPTPAEMYLAHQQGATGAAALITNPNVPATQALQQAGLNPRNVTVNGGQPGMTAGDFVNHWTTKFAQGGQEGDTATPAASAQSPAGGTPALPGVAAGPVTLSPQQARLADLDHDQIKEDATTNSSNLQSGLLANKAGVTMREIRDTLPDVPTGSMAAERQAIGNFTSTFGGPWAQQLSQAVTGMTADNTAKMQEINKLFLNNVVSQEQAVGPGTRIGAMFTNFFAKASPNIDMQKPAIKEILNMGIVGQQMAKDYANASNDYFTNSRSTTANSLAQGGYQRYQPLNQLEGQWTAPGSPHSPEVYAAAAGLMNGRPVTKAFSGMKPDQYHEAVQIISRADPAQMSAIMARPDVIAWRKSLSAGQ
jgi:hypothetical protein